MNIQPSVLEGRSVRLEPLLESHHAALCEVGLDPELWKWVPQQVITEDDMRTYIRNALRDESVETALPFATIHRATGKVVGSTRYLNIDQANRRVEIGATWITQPWQRSPINTEAKYLMLRQAFETFDCVRVEFKTDALNVKSRNAILRIGAREEGALRRHTATWSGRWRDTVYFSVLDSEWPQVKADLEKKMAGAGR